MKSNQSNRVLFFILPVMAIVTGCCNYSPWQGIKGEGPMVERKSSFDEIKGVVVHNSSNVFLTQGKQKDIRIEAQENILENLSMEIEGEVLHIRNNRPVWHSDPVNIHISMEDLRLIKLSGSGNIVSENEFQDLGNVEVAISGSGNIRLSLEARKINGRISGSGSITLEGQCKSSDFSISGSGGIQAMELKSDDAVTRITGSGSIRVYCQDNLDVRISGSGNIYYRGNPRISSSISGSGDLISR